MKLKIKNLFTIIFILSSIICFAQNEFTNVSAYNRVFDNPISTGGIKNLPSLIDFDLDGNVDLMVSYNGSQKVWKGTGTMGWKTINIEVENGSNNIAMGACIWADLNNDGKLDLIVTPVAKSAVTILLQKNFDSRTLYFEDVSDAVNNELPTSACLTNRFIDETRIAIGDFDKNDKLDLLITFYGGKDSPGCPEKAMSPILLIQNESDNLSFSKVVIDEKSISSGAKLCDYNNDGNLDAYISSYRQEYEDGGVTHWEGAFNTLLKWNPGENESLGYFSEATEISTALIRGNNEQLRAFSTGSEWIDFDNDGDFDLLVSNLKHGGRNTGVSALFKNVNGQLTNINQVDLGLLPESPNTNMWHHAQQTVSFDFDNDGDIDIVQPRTSQGECAQIRNENRSRLFVNHLNTENKQFNPVTILGEHFNDDWGVVTGDCNNDGDIDMFTAANYNWGCSNYTTTVGTKIEYCFTCTDPVVSDIKYLRNNLNNNNDFLKIRLKGDTDSNILTAGIGAEIYIDNNQGGIMSRLVEISTSGQKTGSGYLKQFGLGQWDAEAVNVYVKWPDTPTNKVEKFHLTTTDINNYDKPYPITKNEGNFVDRIFYCEVGKTLDFVSQQNSYYSNRYTTTVDLNNGESVVSWEIDAKRNTEEDKFSGDWTTYTWAEDANPFVFNYHKRNDVKIRALVEDANGKHCYSKVAFGYGNINTGADKLMSEQLQTQALMVSPNPATNLITVTLNLNDNNKQNINKIELYNNIGEIVYSEDLNRYSKHTHQISIKDLPAGVYFVNVHQANKIETIKVIKQ